MKKLIIIAGILILSLYLSIGVFADAAPDPSLCINIININVKTCYVDILSNGIEYNISSFNKRYPDSYKNMPIYKYDHDGWLALNIRNSNIWGNIKVNSNASGDIVQNFSSYEIPKTFKVILQLESGELYVSREHSLLSFYQSTIIDFTKEMTLYSSSVTPTPISALCKISGYVQSELSTTKFEDSKFNKDFSVAIDGVKSCITDSKGYFEMTVPASDKGYTIKISKPGYLSRALKTSLVLKDVNLSASGDIIGMWPGDTVKPSNNATNDINSNSNEMDGVINMSDVVNLALSFNQVFGEPFYSLHNDFNMDYSINMMDVIIVAKHFNGSYPELVIPGTSTVTVYGKVVHNGGQGGFYGLMGDGQNYELVNTPNIKDYIDQYVNLTGIYIDDYSSIYMWGKGFYVVSIKPANGF